MYKIVYYPGTYGAFLEFVLNQCLADPQAEKIDPVSSVNTCHDVVWAMRENPVASDRFCSFHESVIGTNEKFLIIDFEPADDVLVMQLLFKRAGNDNIDTENFEKNTYHKVANHTKLVGGNSPSRIIESLNQFSDLSPYANIKDPSWPDIESVEDFYRLPQHIIDECKNVFEFHPFYLSPTTPDAAKWALRHMFKLWFENTAQLPSTYIKTYASMPMNYKLDLNQLYDIDRFKQQLLEVGKYFNLDINLDNFPQETYDRVVTSTTYKNTRWRCEQIIQSVKQGTHTDIKLNIFEEAYVCVLLQREFDLIFPMHKENFFSNTSEIIQLL